MTCHSPRASQKQVNYPNPIRTHHTARNVASALVWLLLLLKLFIARLDRCEISQTSDKTWCNETWQHLGDISWDQIRRTKCNLCRLLPERSGFPRPHTDNNFDCSETFLVTETSYRHAESVRNNINTFRVFKKNTKTFLALIDREPNENPICSGSSFEKAVVFHASTTETASRYFV